MSSTCRLLCVGKLNPKMESLSSSMAKKAKIDLVIVPDCPDGDVKRSVKSESDRILEKIDSRDKVILFDLQGKPCFFDGVSDRNDAFRRERIVYIVGGSNGVDDRVKKRADGRVSVSGLTFPHALFRLAAIEMIAGIRRG